MSVRLPNARLGVRRRVEGARNSHGEAMAAGWGTFDGPYDGRVNEKPDGTWALGLDRALWPIRKDDLVINLTGGSWLVQTSDLITLNIPDSHVDWVRVSGLHRSAQGTEPGGAWFVARYTDYVEPPPPTPSGPVYEAGVWTGYGPPPAAGGDFQPEAGDEYVDLLTGLVYVLDVVQEAGGSGG